MTGTDIRLSLDGQTVLKNGDFDLEYDLDEAVTNRMLRSSNGSWSFDGDIGIGLQDFAGLPNNQANATAIEDAVVTGLRKVGISAQCTVYPITFDSVAIQVLVFTTQGAKQLPFSFRYDGGLVTYIKNTVQDTGFKVQSPANKYDRRYGGIGVIYG
jgi:hypothetical protein